MTKYRVNETLNKVYNCQNQPNSKMQMMTWM